MPPKAKITRDMVIDAEAHLFRFIFQSGFATENSLLEMIDSKELIKVHLKRVYKGAILTAQEENFSEED